ncbi:MAG TPA: nucleotide exchange factor GrpE [Candidatus Methylacidiphilales bacterium]|nr:nucleotide exchange factor GrpE [Candidatus Methylacidiphilales bacterium]
MSSEKSEKEAPKQPEAPAYIVVSNELFQETAKLAAESTVLKDRLLRSQADWENSRKRILREKEDAVRYAGEELLERLLPILDNFEMGMQAAKTATDTNAIVQGFEMVQAQFRQFLREAGIEPIEAVGQPFDPHRHEALGHHETDEHPEGHVVSQMRKGYKLKDRLLRPASVFVAKTPEGKQAPRKKD